MQIIKLKLDHYNFYCPVTGNPIMDGETLDLTNSALLAHWFDEDFLNPHINELSLRMQWEDYKRDFDSYHYIDSSLILNFLEGYQSMDYVAFSISENGTSVQSKNHQNIFVIDMNYSNSEG